jgi:hypothetical protein
LSLTPQEIFLRHGLQAKRCKDLKIFICFALEKPLLCICVVQYTGSCSLGKLTRELFSGRNWPRGCSLGEIDQGAFVTEIHLRGICDAVRCQIIYHTPDDRTRNGYIPRWIHTKVTLSSAEASVGYDYD